MKLCIVCKLQKATIPDRDRPGRPIARLCSMCHADRLVGDLVEIVKDMYARETPRED